jgi:hypothetical protein
MMWSLACSCEHCCCVLSTSHSSNCINDALPMLFCHITKCLIKNYQTAHLMEGATTDKKHDRIAPSGVRSKPSTSSAPKQTVGIFVGNKLSSAQFCCNATVSISDSLKAGLHLTHAKFNDALHKLDVTSGMSDTTRKEKQQNQSINCFTKTETAIAVLEPSKKQDKNYDHCCMMTAQQPSLIYPRWSV